eukprot:CAMPEP_0178396196 /NCGR_PEP_ID=MMETSP0689_2-20121128/13607_1 /TAXON_ID=160604 /ORGANISM="Amphidinium massartii, Strain CS-259" /LENGTH=339 /DNA_ID=CAMNT_0020016869 /DNA_START=43 /DNA_END=1059 /DNA_ORIENTATION=-
MAPVKPRTQAQMEAGKKAAETRQRLAAARQDIQGMQRTAKFTSKNVVEDTAAAFVKQLEEDKFMLFMLKLLYDNGTLRAMILTEEEEEEPEPVEVAAKPKLLRPSCRRWKDITQRWVTEFLRAVSPEAAEAWEASETIDYKGLVCFALNTARDVEIGWKTKPALQNEAVLVEAAKERYFKMGLRLANGIPEKFTYWELSAESMELVLTIREKSHTFKLWKSVCPADAQLEDADTIYKCKITSESLVQPFDCYRFVVSRELTDDMVWINDYCISEEMPWNISSEILDSADSDVGPGDSVSVVDSPAASCVSAAPSAVKRAKAVTALEERLNKKARSGKSG